MFRRRKVKSSKRNLKPFQRHYVKDVGSYITFGMALTMFVLVLVVSVIFYKILEALGVY